MASACEAAGAAPLDRTNYITRADVALVDNADAANAGHTYFRFEKIVWPYRLAIPVLFLIGAYVRTKKFVYSILGLGHPRTNFWLVDGVSLNSRRVKEGAARWPALDVAYNFRAGEGVNAFCRWIDGFWMQIRNAQAVRNRLRIAKRELMRAVMSVQRCGEPVRVLSLAAGSAQGVIEMVAQAKLHGIEVRLLLLDIDQSALQYALELARLHGVEEHVDTREGDVLFFDRKVGGFEPDIVEMLGLADYLETKIVIMLFRKIRRILKPQGFLLTCHVHPNSEVFFLRHVVNWDMIYRTIGEFKELLIASDFVNSSVITEPHGIHSIAVAQKTA